MNMPVWNQLMDIWCKCMSSAVFFVPMLQKHSKKFDLGYERTRKTKEISQNQIHAWLSPGGGSSSVTLDDLEKAKQGLVWFILGWDITKKFWSYKQRSWKRWQWLTFLYCCLDNLINMTMKQSSAQLENCYGFFFFKSSILHAVLCCCFISIITKKWSLRRCANFLLKE